MGSKKYTIDFDSIWELHEILKLMDDARHNIIIEKLGGAQNIKGSKFNSFKPIIGCYLLDASQLTEEQMRFITSEECRQLEDEQYKTLGVRINNEKE